MKIYYPNLNSLRFFAVSLVLIHHIEQHKLFNGIKNHFGNASFFLFGKLGVSIFFVLSGFLITSLLLIEKDTYLKIDIKKFYIRRILRIWPLYFLTVILCLFVFPLFKSFGIPGWIDPHHNLWGNIFLFFAFLPNLQIVVYGPLAYAAQTWSIGVEEQFYLFWPLIANCKLDLKKLKLLIVIMILGFLIIMKFLYTLNKLDPGSQFKLVIYNFWTDSFRIDCMMIGAYFAIVNIEKKWRFLFNRYIQAFTYLTIIICMSFGVLFKLYFWEVYSVLFGIIIINLVNKTSILNLENTFFNYMGKCSYSIYLVHNIVISIVIKLITHNNLLIYIYSLFFTLALSIATYELFEKRFLRSKIKFELIKSG